MALFKICRGNESNLPTTLTDGYAYFCTDTGNFYIDWADSDGNVRREHISAEYATKLRYKDDNGEWVEIDPKDLIENQVQADWDEIDAASKSYILNRPFGLLPDIVEASDINSPESSVVNGIYKAETGISVSDLGLNVGENYIVVFDEETYTCTYTQVGYLMSNGTTTMTVPILGDPHLISSYYPDWSINTEIDGDSDYPFAISPLGVLTATSGEHTVAIRGTDGNNFKKLDVKYLPDEAATKQFVADEISKIDIEQVQADWSETDTTSKSYIKNKPFDDTIPNSYFDFMEEISDENSGATTYKIKSDYLPAFDTESVSITVTLSANMWASSQQVLSVNGVTAETNGFVGVAQNITDAQMVAAKLAELHVCGQGDGTITVAAFGDTPNCDIPITIILV